MADLLGNNSITLGEWIFVAVTYDSNILKLYFNAIEDSSLLVAGIIRDSATELLIGASYAHGGITENFNGVIDDVRIYNRALSSDEIRVLFNVGGEVCTNGIDDDNDGLVDCTDPECCDDPACFNTQHCTTIYETVLAQNGTLNNVNMEVILPDPEDEFTCTFDSANLELVRIDSSSSVALRSEGSSSVALRSEGGAFKDKGFSKGTCQITCGAVQYTGEWRGVIFRKPPESEGSSSVALRSEDRNFYLKGAITGGITATVEGYLSESVPGSENYDKYQATWQVGRLGGGVISVTLNLNGNVSYQNETAYNGTNLLLVRDNIEATDTGDYKDVGDLSIVLTHLRVVSEDNPYVGEGFSIVSYNSQSGSGQGWTYDRLFYPGFVEMKGLFGSPLYGIATAILNDSDNPRTMDLAIERIDEGIPPMADLEVRTWGPYRVSPGQTVDYLVEYRNDGVANADDVVVVLQLPPEVEYISSTNEGIYRWETHEVIWKLGTLIPQSKGNLSAKVKVQWGLPWGTQLGYNALIGTTSEEKDLYPDGTPLFDITEYLDYQPPEPPIVETFAAQDKLSELLQDTQFADLYEYATELGFEAGVQILKLTRNDGIIVIMMPMIHPIGDKVLSVIKVTNQDQTSDSFLFDMMGENFISMFNREGGIKFFSDGSIEEMKAESLSIRGCSYWANMWNCLVEKFGLFVVKQAFIQWQIKVATGATKLSFPAFLINMGIDVGHCLVKSTTCVPGSTKSTCNRMGLGNIRIDYACDNECKWKEIHRENCTEKCPPDSVCVPGVPYCLPSNCNEKPPNKGSGGSGVLPARDPNIKYGPSGAVVAGQTLNYRIEFENEGEGIAYGVYFTDTLDEDLDTSTFSAMGDSEETTLEIGPVIQIIDGVEGPEIGPPGTYKPATRTITWFVSGEGEIGPNVGGYAEISVNVKSGSANGTEIINYGTVYFPSVPEETRTNAIVSRIPLIEFCDDGIDNDEDGFTDCEDPECSGSGCEEGEAQNNCNDGIDNDGDGWVDCADPDSDCPPCPEDCYNGLDDDEDGYIDCDDSDCAGSPACCGDSMGYAKGISSISFKGGNKDKATLRMCVNQDFCDALKAGVEEITLRLDDCNEITVPGSKLKANKKKTKFNASSSTYTLKIDCIKGELTLKLKNTNLSCVSNLVKTCISIKDGPCLCAEEEFEEKLDKKDALKGMLFKATGACSP